MRAPAGSAFVAGAGQKNVSARAWEKGDRLYDTKYFISDCADDLGRGRLGERRTDAERRAHVAQGCEESRKANAASQVRGRLENSFDVPVNGRLELREGRMDTFRRLQI